MEKKKEKCVRFHFLKLNYEINEKWLLANVKYVAQT